MAATLSERKNIIMNFGMPPSLDDLKNMAEALMETLPEELFEHFDELEIVAEDLPDDTVKHDLDLENDYDLLAYYSSASQLAPGVEKKQADGDDRLILYRRPILDYWCETGEDLSEIVRQVMIEEIGAHFELSDEDIEELTQRHYQGLL